MITRRWLAATALLLLFACGSGDDDTAEPSTEAPATAGGGASTTLQASPATTTAATGCGVTLTDVQALLPAGSGVTQNRTPDAGRCNFTWNDNGARGIDVARVPGGRSAFEQQSASVPNGPTNLKDGSPYETIAGAGERAWAFGDARHANVVALRGADLFVVDLVIDGPAPAGSRSSSGMDAKSLEICQALLRKALA